MCLDPQNELTLFFSFFVASLHLALKTKNEKLLHVATLKRISVVMVKPWVIMGSSSGGLPFQQSSSRQRHPDSRHWRYISGEDTPENWPAAWVRDRKTKYKKKTHTWPSEFRSYEDLSATFKAVYATCQVCVVGGFDEVVGYGLGHVLTPGQPVLHDYWCLRPNQEI